jgi:copper(I)-binding protein
MDTRCHVGPLLALACSLAILLVPTDASAIFIVTEPWMRLAADARSAEMYMELRSTEGATLVGVTTDVTVDVTIRPPGTTRTPLKEIKLPAGETVMLAPGKHKFVLARLNRRLKLGDHVAFVLTIEAADGGRTEVPLSAEIRRHSPTDDHRHGHSH